MNRTLSPILLVLAALMIAAPGAARAAEAPIVLSGSTTFQKRVLEPVKAELEKRAGRPIEMRGVGTVKGLKELIKGEASAAMMSVPLETALLETGVPEEGTYLEHVILKDTLVPIVHPSSPVKSLSLEQVGGILSGKIATWKEVGGPDQKIVVFIPPKTSGTRKFLKDSVMNGSDFPGTAFTAVTTREVVDLVSQAPLGFSVLSDGLVRMSPGKVKTVKCKPLSRQLCLVTKGEPSKELQTMIAFLRSEKAKKLYK